MASHLTYSAIALSVAQIFNAVSQVCNLQNVRSANSQGPQELAQTLGYLQIEKSAIQQVANLRYGQSLGMYSISHSRLHGARSF